MDFLEKMFELVDTPKTEAEPNPLNSSVNDGLRYDLPFRKRFESLLNDKFLSDVTFLVDKETIYAHKLLLIISSEYFNTMFNGNFKESNIKQITISDIEPEIFIEILRFIYCQKIRLTIDNALEIYFQAEKFMLNELMLETTQFLKKNINAANVLKFFDQNIRYGFSFIDIKCLSMIRKNPLEYFNKEDFLLLNQRLLEIIFSSQKINCSSEQMIQAFHKWKKANGTEYTGDLGKMFRAERSYCCAKLRFFGVLHMAHYTDLKFTPNSCSLALYGIGVFVKSPRSLVPIYVEISDKLGVLYKYQFDFNNKDLRSVSVANLFFPMLRLRTKMQYNISVKLDTREGLTLKETKIFHDQLKLSFDNDNSTGSIVAHLFYDIIC